MHVDTSAHWAVIHHDLPCSVGSVRPPGRRFRLALLLGVLVLLCAPVRQALAGWTIDPARRHAGVHAELACADCHEGIVPGPGHPDPTAVTRSLGSFFRPERCTNCHDGIQDELDQGRHAGKPCIAGKDYQQCLSCHDPHYQVGKKALAAGFNPDRPVRSQCGVCHAKRDALPTQPAAEQVCLDCHRAVTAPADAARAASERLCLSCHGPIKKTGLAAVPGMATMDASALASVSHKTVACLDCHQDAARFNHANQTRKPCLTCHARHDEKVTHDAHLSVTCEACHLPGTKPAKTNDGRIVARIDPTRQTGTLAVHTMGLTNDEAACKRCHFSGNTLGASASVLPAKSVLCMACHAATFSVGDATTVIALLALAAGAFLVLVFWFSGTGLGERAVTPPGHAAPEPVDPDRGRRLLSVFWYDILLQRGLYRESRTRWAIHALIFFPFVFRFLWGLAGLLGSLWLPRTAWPWLLLDKNNPLGGLLFDVSGLALLAGLVLAGLAWHRKRDDAVPGLPGRDWAALFLLGAIVVVGFLLEGLRIAMTGFPAGSDGAFAGTVLAIGWNALLSPRALSGFYGVVWYAHAILTGVTVAYLPFSQLRHVVTAPLALLIRAFAAPKRPEKERRNDG